jgi:hypothetical protein
MKNSGIPSDVIAASEEFRIRRDAERYRFLRSRPHLGKLLQYQRREEIDAWVDLQMKKSGV